jgi:outer membrane protein OmpA-like peptidoglycan-associated protein
MVPSDIPLRMMGIGFGIKPVTIHNLLTPIKALHFSFQTNDKKISEGLKYGGKEITDGPAYKTIDYKTPLNKIIHLAFEINGRRIRLFVDEKKLVDLPTGFNAQLFKSLYLTASTHGAKESKENYFYVANVTLAETVKDLRSSVIKDLFEKGKASTTAIQFKVNSDAILPESNSIILELVTALKSDATTKIKIIGHTDSDGDDVKNLALSKKRALAVKLKLVAAGIKTDRILTDGKGESEPAEENSTPEGKAKNRRVEFLKVK